MDASVSVRIEAGSNKAMGMSDYKLLDVLGEGSFGRVHQARVRATGESVAIKVLSIDEEPELLEREIALMKSTAHAHLVEFFCYFVHKRQVAVTAVSCSVTHSRCTPAAGDGVLRCGVSQ